MKKWLFVSSLVLSLVLSACSTEAAEELELAPQAGNPIITGLFTADPSAHVWPSDPTRLFLYPSQDIFPPRGCDLMDRYHVFSTDNMADWVNHGEILRRADLDEAVWGVMYPYSYFMWAPDAAFNPNHPDGHGPYFFIFPVQVGPHDGEHIWKLGIAHSDRPEGGFRDNPVIMLTYPSGEPISGCGQYIDPSIYWDRDTNTHYLAVGGAGVLRVARLSPCFTTLAEDFVVFPDIEYFHEGPWIFTRVNDYGTKIYYVMYAAGKYRDLPASGNLSYSTSTEGFFGPWTYGGTILAPGVTDDTSHGSIVEFLGQWYLFYHTDVLSMGHGTLRSSGVDLLFFNPDGSIRPVERTAAGVPAVGPPTCHAYLNERFGEGRWSIETRFEDYMATLEGNFEGFALDRAYSVMEESVVVYLANVQANTRAVHNLHIHGSYVEFRGVYGGAGRTALLELNYAAQGGGIARVTVNGESRALRVPATGGWENFTGASFMRVDLEPGYENTIRVDGTAMNVRGISVHFAE